MQQVRYKIDDKLKEHAIGMAFASVAESLDNIYLKKLILVHVCNLHLQADRAQTFRTVHLDS